LLAVSIITSCKKSINEKEEQRSSVALTTPGNSCRAIGLGWAVKDTPGNPNWENLMLKWFDSQGKIEHLKAVIYWFYQSPTYNSRAFVLDYGEVTHVNDEVHVRDVLYNEEVFKVKLDAQKRPVISWFDHHGRSQSTFRYDTSYYFYNSDNQLESVIVHRRDLIGGFGGIGGDGIFNMRFQYDPVGNLVEANVPDGTFQFRYDYTRTNAGMVSNYLISVPIKLLEYLDLLKLNHHHQLQDVIWRPPQSGYFVLYWAYSNIETNLFGQVTRYDGSTNGSPISTYYTAWDCGGNQTIQSKNPTQSEFMCMVH
jgi:YD repeat-containing protein